MQTARVVGRAVATVKHPSMDGWKLLLVQVYQIDGKTPDGEPMLAIDSVGAGVGETVIISSDGRSTRELLGNNQTPVRWCIVGICD